MESVEESQKKENIQTDEDKKSLKEIDNQSKKMRYNYFSK